MWSAFLSENCAQRGRATFDIACRLDDDAQRRSLRGLRHFFNHVCKQRHHSKFGCIVLARKESRELDKHFVHIAQLIVFAKIAQSDHRTTSFKHSNRIERFKHREQERLDQALAHDRSRLQWILRCRERTLCEETERRQRFASRLEIDGFNASNEHVELGQQRVEHTIDHWTQLLRVALRAAASASACMRERNLSISVDDDSEIEPIKRSS
jgi:hypothetical protein